MFKYISNIFKQCTGNQDSTEYTEKQNKCWMCSNKKFKFKHCYLCRKCKELPWCDECHCEFVKCRKHSNVYIIYESL